MPTNTELVDQLLQDTTLTGRPSQHLRALRKLGQRIGTTENVVRHRLFQRSLPRDLAVVVTMQDLTSGGIGKAGRRNVGNHARNLTCTGCIPAAEVVIVKRLQGMNK